MFKGLKGKFAVVAVFFGFDEAGKAMLERGMGQEQHDEILYEVVNRKDSEGFMKALLDKGTSEEARDEALYQCIPMIGGVEKVKMLLAVGTSEKGRNAALRQLAAFGSERTGLKEKMALLFEAGVSSAGTGRAIGKAVEFGNVEALEILFERFNREPAIQDPAIQDPALRHLQEQAISDIKRKDLTIGVERILIRHNLLPKP